MTDTKLTDTVYIDKALFLHHYRQPWIDFFNDNPSPIDAVFQTAQTLMQDRWVSMKTGEGVDIAYDHAIKACWYPTESNYEVWVDDIDAVSQKLRKIDSRYHFELPSFNELITSKMEVHKKGGTLLASVIGSFYDSILYLDQGQLKAYDLNRKEDDDKGVLQPILRLTQPDRFDLSDKEVFFRWVALGLVPNKFKEDGYEEVYETYKELIAQMQNFTIDNFFEMHPKEEVRIASDIIKTDLLEEDTVRANLAPYPRKILTDINLGHWSLWEGNKAQASSYIRAKLDEKLVAKNPASSIVNGTVGIDFGTKSTVVVYQKNTAKIHPMRIGTGDLSKIADASHYENPTFMEFNNFEKFLQAYGTRSGRPYTRWEDITVSHAAFHSMLNSPSEFFDAYVGELKQWAGDKQRKLKIVDKQKNAYDLPPFLEIEEHPNPIEIYAYYLGLYINNQNENQGIFLDYILSFPVTYEVGVRNKIIESFRRGLLKSLPQELHGQPEIIQKLTVRQGASEPAAYAIVALQEYGFDPQDDETVFYGVFDFGGGTTDFDFGIFRESQGAKESRYDYVIEHFGSGGDRYLGGENLLELLSFEVFKHNAEKLLEHNIQFVLPSECEPFPGSENLLSHAREAKLNTKNLMEILRPFWEGDQQVREEFEKGVVHVNLFNIEAQSLANFELDIDIEQLETILYRRIQKGVENFFHALRLAFSRYSKQLHQIETVHIFLAGNSSKSALVKKIFKQKIEQETEAINAQFSLNESERFKLYEPLQSDELNKPNGKTGVAFGLLQSRKGSNIRVIDKNIDDYNINFKYYLGRNRKNKFKVIVDRSTKYNRWVPFIDASEEVFDIYYSSQPVVSTNQVPIDENGIKKMTLTIDTIDEDALVYLRIVSPTRFEYVVAHDSDIHKENYINQIVSVELEG